MINYLGASGYAIVALLYAMVAALSLVGWTRGRIGGLFIVACIFSALWACVMTLESVGRSVHPMILFAAEGLRSGLWISFLAALCAYCGVGRRIRWAVQGVWIAILVSGFGLWLASGWFDEQLPVSMMFLTGALIVALSGLVLIEQLYRNSSTDNRARFKILVIGLGGMFAYDLFLYSQGVLFGTLDSHVWSARGVVNSLFVPMLAIAARRNEQWNLDIFVSRHVVFYTTTLVAVGIYLLLMSAGGYAILLYGGNWGGLAQTVFFVGAILVLVVLLFSSSLRGQLRVFLSKHFFRNKYDYREEWLRLISTLSGFDAGTSRTIVVKALAQIVGSPSGQLWTFDEAFAEFRLVGNYEADVDAPLIRLDDPMISFIRSSRWLIDLDEYRQNPELYQNVKLPDWLINDERAWLLVPLEARRKIRGLVLLHKPTNLVKLNYEDRDLLKTAGHHIAVHLAQQDADNRLAEAQQFEAYNKLTAFLMHDLNNLIAQQSLIVRNAERHKRNPEFVDDAMQTISGSVARMKRIMAQLRRREDKSHVQSTVLKFLISAAVDRCNAQRPAPDMDLTGSDVEISVDKDRFIMVLTHLIKNAQDATADDGAVSVSVESAGEQLCVLVTDTGSGMSPGFIRDRLFKPFDSTKGSQGMGIGVYQAREYARSLGGDLKVRSVLAAGSTFIMSFPMAANELETPA